MRETRVEPDIIDRRLTMINYGRQAFHRRSDSPLWELCIVNHKMVEVNTLSHKERTHIRVVRVDDCQEKDEVEREVNGDHV